MAGRSMTAARGLLVAAMLLHAAPFAVTQDATQHSTGPAGAQASSAAGDPAAEAGIRARIGQEFEELQALLAQVPEYFGASRKWGAPDPCSELAARLAVFQFRFGSDPRLVPQWPELQSAAQALLDRLDDPAMRAPPSDHDVPRQMDRAVLLDLVGRTEESRAILDGAVVRGADGCINCTAENGVVVYQRRSEACERGGDLEGALKWQHEACFELPNAVIGGAVHAGASLIHARYGLLLCRTGHESSGEIVLRATARLYPQSVGAQLSRAELHRRGVADDGPEAEIEVHVLEWNSFWRMLGVIALSDKGRPGWLEIVAVRLPNSEKVGGSHTVAFDLDAFEQLRPFLDAMRSLPDRDAWKAGWAVRLTQGLRGGAAPYVEPLLAHLRPQPAASHAVGFADATLRWLHDGGPALPSALDECTGDQFAAAWLQWLSLR